MLVVSAIKQSGDLIGRPSDRGGRRHDLRAHAVFAGASRGKLINRRFIQPGDRSKRARQ